jgi:hypothetical protein
MTRSRISTLICSETVCLHIGGFGSQCIRRLLVRINSAGDDDVSIIMMITSPEYLVISNVVVCVLLIFLASLQRRYLDKFSVASIVLVCFDGICAVYLYGGTVYFPAASFGLSAILLIHGAMIHFPLECVGPPLSCPAFRIRCVCNHETWVLVGITAGLVSAFSL